MRIKRIFKFLISIILPLGVGFASSFATMSSVSTWYQEIAKPVFTPPDWLFAPAWTALYVLMGLAFYNIWISESKYKSKAAFFFLIQLVLNGLWSVIFFGLQAPLAAFVELVSLLILIIITTYYSYKISKHTIWYLLPYIGWVTFAGALNLSIVLLN
ncbi:MAG TPA: TspO/MBR family protein [Candidatus Paceibacterota bacterium]|nr:TspO/MBR family protein [Candidatus Paceibacterota bacterium]